MSALTHILAPVEQTEPLPSLPAVAVRTTDPIWRMSVETYHALINAAVLTENDRVELIEGVLVFKMPIDEIHVAVCAALNDLIKPLLDPLTTSYREQAPITLRDSEPEPDGAIASGSRHYFARLGRKPYENEVLWIAEVSNTTLRTDRGSKLRVYARAGIAFYWIVNLDEGVIEVYSDPDPAAAQPTYRTMTPYRTGQRIPVIVSGRTVGEVAYDDILP